MKPFEPLPLKIYQFFCHRQWKQMGRTGLNNTFATLLNIHVWKLMIVHGHDSFLSVFVR